MPMIKSERHAKYLKEVGAVYAKTKEMRIAAAKNPEKLDKVNKWAAAAELAVASSYDIDRCTELATQCPNSEKGEATKQQYLKQVENAKKNHATSVAALPDLEKAVMDTAP